VARDIQEQVGRVGQFLDSDTGRQLVGAAVSELLGGFGASRTTKAKNKAKKLARDRTKDIGGTLSRALGDGLSGTRGLAAGAGAAALAPVAVKGISKLVKSDGSLAEGIAGGPKKLAEGAVSKVGEKVSDKVGSKIDDAGGPSGILKDTVKSALPFGGGGGTKNDAQGVGKGRRMPIQQSVDIGLPLETVYNQWTQFQEWPKFMHRVKRVTQEDPRQVSFAVKIWGKTKEFTADIETQRPDDRIKWKTTEGMTHSGVVTFRELGPNLTRVLLSFDVDPGGLLEKYARGARYVKRAARADLHRFVAFIEMLEHETGAWRGRIEDGEVVEDHDPAYDRKREYASADELLGGSDDEESDDDSSASGRNGGDPSRRGRRTGSGRGQSGTRAASSRSSSRGGSSRSSGRSGSSGSGRSSSSRSGSARSSGSSSGRRRSSGSSGGGRSSGSSGSAKSSGSSGSGRSSSASGRSRSSSSGSRSTGNSSGSRSSARSRSTRSSGAQGRQRTRSASRS